MWKKTLRGFPLLAIVGRLKGSGSKPENTLNFKTQERPLSDHAFRVIILPAVERKFSSGGREPPFSRGVGPPGTLTR